MIKLYVPNNSGSGEIHSLTISKRNYMQTDIFCVDCERPTKGYCEKCGNPLCLKCASKNCGLCNSCKEFKEVDNDNEFTRNGEV